MAKKEQRDLFRNNQGYAFQFYFPDGSLHTNELYTFPLNPESLSVQTTTRDKIQETLEGKPFVDTYPTQLKNITMSGTFGYNLPHIADINITGWERFSKLRDLFNDFYRFLKQNQIGNGGGNPTNRQIVFYNHADNETYEVVIQQWGFLRNIQKRNLYQYNITMIGIGDAKSQSLSGLNKDSYKSKLAQTKDSYSKELQAGSIASGGGKVLRDIKTNEDVAIRDTVLGQTNTSIFMPDYLDDVIDTKDLIVTRKTDPVTFLNTLSPKITNAQLPQDKMVKSLIKQNNALYEDVTLRVKETRKKFTMVDKVKNLFSYVDGVQSNVFNKVFSKKDSLLSVLPVIDHKTNRFFDVPLSTVETGLDVADTFLAGIKDFRDTISTNVDKVKYFEDNFDFTIIKRVRQIKKRLTNLKLIGKRILGGKVVGKELDEEGLPVLSFKDDAVDQIEEIIPQPIQKNILLSNTPLKVEDVTLTTDPNKNGRDYLLDVIEDNIVLKDLPQGDLRVVYTREGDVRTDFMSCSFVYRVDDSDDIKTISMKAYGTIDKWEDIVIYNELIYPYLINDRDYQRKFYASGQVTFARQTGAIGDITIPAGTRVATDGSLTEIVYVTDNTVILLNGQDLIDVDVTCTEYGELGNVFADRVTVLLDTITDIAGLTASSAMTGGKYINVLLPGDLVKIPKLGFSDISCTREKTTDEWLKEIFGTDIYIGNDGTIYTTPIGDLQTLSGIDNIIQAIRNRWRTQKGEIPYLPNYGSNLYELLGMENQTNIKDFITVDLIQTALQDPRIQSIKLGLLDIDADKITVEAEIETVVVKDSINLVITI